MATNYQSNVGRVKKKLTEQQKKALKDIKTLILKPIKQKARKLTGNLRKNIKSRIDKKEKRLIIGIGKKAFYGGFYELGAKNVPKDPFIMPVIEEKTGEMQKIIKDYLGELED